MTDRLSRNCLWVAHLSFRNLSVTSNLKFTMNFSEKENMVRKPRLSFRGGPCPAVGEAGRRLIDYLRMIPVALKLLK